MPEQEPVSSGGLDPEFESRFAEVIGGDPDWSELDALASDGFADLEEGDTPSVCITELVPHIKASIDALTMISGGAYNHKQYAFQLQDYAETPASENQFDPEDVEDVRSELTMSLAHVAANFFWSAEASENDESLRRRKVFLADIFMHQYGDDSLWLLRLIDYAANVEPEVSTMNEALIQQYVYMQMGRTHEDTTFAANLVEHIEERYETLLGSELAIAFPDIFDQSSLRGLVISLGLTHGRYIFEKVSNRYIFPEAQEYVKELIQHEDEVHMAYVQNYCLATNMSEEEFDVRLKPFFLGIARLVFRVFSAKYGYEYELTASDMQYDEHDEYDMYQDFELWEIDDFLSREE